MDNGKERGKTWEGGKKEARKEGREVEHKDGKMDTMEEGKKEPRKTG